MLNCQLKRGFNWLRLYCFFGICDIWVSFLTFLRKIPPYIISIHKWKRDHLNSVSATDSHWHEDNTLSLIRPSLKMEQCKSQLREHQQRPLSVGWWKTSREVMSALCQSYRMVCRMNLAPSSLYTVPALLNFQMIHFYPESWTTLKNQAMVTAILFALFSHALYMTDGTSLRVWILEWRWALNNAASVQQPGYGA